MKIHIFRQLFTGEFETTPEDSESPTDEQSLKEDQKELIGRKERQTIQFGDEKCLANVNAPQEKRSRSWNTHHRKVSVYRSKTGSIYATKTSTHKSCTRDNDGIKRQKEKSPTAQRARQRTGVIKTTTNLAEDIKIKNEVQNRLGYVEIVYYILTLQFLLDFVILVFNTFKRYIQSFIDYYIYRPVRRTFNTFKRYIKSFIDCYIYCPVRRTYNQVKSFIQIIKNWCVYKFHTYLIQPIEYIGHSFVIPSYRLSCSLISNVHWCLKNSKKYCVLLIEVLCLRISKLAENFRHYFAVILLIKIIPEDYSMAYHLFALFRLVLGTLYPAYASYKAVRTKNVREYVSSLHYQNYPNFM